MATTTVAHASLIRYDDDGNQLVINLKNTGDDVSISRDSNGNLPSSVTTTQTLANALGALAFKSSLSKADVGLGNVNNTADSDKSVNYASTSGSSPKLSKAAHLSNDTELDNFLATNVFQYATVAGLASLNNNDGIILSASWNGSTNYGHQIYIDDNSSLMMQRGRNSGTWGSWVKMIDSSNIGSQSVNYASTAGSANAVTWDNVTGKPSVYTPASHTHTKSQITDFPTSLPASDVYAWAKAASKPSYTKSEVGLGNVDNTADANKSVNYASTAGAATKVTRIKHLSTAEELDGFVEANAFQYATVAGIAPINNDGIILSMTWKDSTNYAHQIYINDDSALMMQRGRNNGTWGDWVRVIDSSNIGSQSVNYATSAGSANAVAWGNVSGKPSTFAPSSHTHSKSEVGLGSVDNTADADKSVKHATSSDSSSSATKATHVVDYANTGAVIDIGYNGSGISGDAIKFIAGYTTGANGSTARIKDISKSALISWMGVLPGDNIFYVSKEAPTVPCIWAKID